jgi:pentatricopeptide repeat protein
MEEFLNVDTLSQAALLVLHRMEENMVCGRPAPLADSQSYCLAAASLQNCPEAGASTAISLFRNATNNGIPADGRFVNAVLRCFGEDIDLAIDAWKSEIRPLVLKHENRSRLYVPPNRPAGKNLVAAYNGLLYVSGRAMRPDIALRLIYAMKREGLEPNENSFNAFKSGKRRAKPSQDVSIRSRLLKLIDPYESLLYVECMKYDSTDKRRRGEHRVRIIV